MNPSPKTYAVSNADRNRVAGSILSIWSVARKEYYKFEGYSDLFEESGTKWVEEHLCFNLVKDDEGALDLNLDVIGYVFNPLHDKDDLIYGLDMALVWKLYSMFHSSVKRPMSVTV